MVNNLRRGGADQTKKLFDELMGEGNPNDYKASKPTEEFKRNSFHKEESKSIYRKTQQDDERDKKISRLERKVEEQEAHLEGKTRTIKNLETHLNTQKSENDKQKTAIEVLQKQLAEAQTDIQQLKQKLKSNIEEDKHGDQLEDSEFDVEQNNIKLQKATQVYNQHKKENETFDENFFYLIDMDKKDHLKILEYTSEVKFPLIQRLYIKYLPSPIDHRVEKLLKYSFPNSLKIFTFWYYKSNSKHEYLDALAAIISKTTYKVFIGVSEMDYDEFSGIVKASRHINILVFSCLKFIKSGTIDFGKNIDYNINTLSLQYTGRIYNSDWREDKRELNSIVEQIKQSNMHHQLQYFGLYYCNVDPDDVDLPGVNINQEFINRS